MATATKANQVADAVVTLLRQVDARIDETAWHTAPKVYRSLDPNAVETRPSVMVQMGSWSDVPQSGRLHQVTARILLYCAADSDEELNNLVRDVTKMITDNEDDLLGGLVMQVWTDANYEPQSQREGISSATLDFGVVWEWAHGAP